METGKKSLSKREQVMLFFIATVGLFVVVYMYVITPLNEEIDEKKVQLADINMRWRVIESQLRTEDEIREAQEEAFERYYEIRDKYIEQQLNHEFGRVLTLLVREHEFREMTQGISNVTGFTEGGITGRPVFSVSSVGMSIGGGYEQLQSLLDGVIEIPSMGIPTFSISLGGPDGDHVENVPISFRVIMFDQVRIESELDMIRNPPE